MIIIIGIAVFIFFLVPFLMGDKEIPQTNVSLYYYNADKDKNAIGNIECSRNGLVAVQRSIPETATPIEDTINLLLKGELTPQEKAEGITTEYPLPGFRLLSTTLENGILTLQFSDPENKTGGGSCRVGILWFQIEATAQQLSGVIRVQFKPEELFQP
ncbi:GerMN domain-containing protein [Candidatus Gracilibacteria bacterium]|nr:GerMN domain-containing protein [Candidatus Gracilibacteria bacterium]